MAMERKWTLDTCDCIIVMELPFHTWLRTEQKCGRHLEFEGPELLREVMTDNRFENMRKFDPDIKREDVNRIAEQTLKGDGPQIYENAELVIRNGELKSRFNVRIPEPKESLIDRIRRLFQRKTNS